jgi:AAA+ ATPase superfamily predicted ATPase
MSRPFIGRKQEPFELLEKKTASLLLIKGRRRIGKSRLVEEVAKNQTFYHFSGTPSVRSTTVQSQLNEFARQLSTQTGIPQIVSNDWSKLFILLHKDTPVDRAIILFDKILFMGSKDRECIGYISRKILDRYSFRVDRCQP